MTFSPLTTRTSGNGRQFSSRGGRKIDRFIVHHGATTSLNGMLSMFATGSRQVSCNYAIKDNEIVGVVQEEDRAWTSGSADWDGRAITVETANSVAGDAAGWPISEESYVSLAKLIADCATRYGFAINRDTVIGHRELYTRYGASYATACPGGINLDRLVRMAQEYQKTGTPGSGSPEGDELTMAQIDDLTKLINDRFDKLAKAVADSAPVRAMTNTDKGKIHLVSTATGNEVHIPSTDYYRLQQAYGIFSGNAQNAPEFIIAYTRELYAALGTDGVTQAKLDEIAKRLTDEASKVENK